jgi:hypothetical protein
MKIAYFPNQTALQSAPVWMSFLDGCREIGLTPVENDMDAECAVIWSTLWSGRMRNNKSVFDHYRKNNKPVFIIEVGSLLRGTTWKIALNNITAGGIYPNLRNLDQERPKKLGISLGEEKKQRLGSILLAAQHPESHQWNLMPEINLWVKETIRRIRIFSKRPIIVRQHPRYRLMKFEDRNVIFEHPIKLDQSYDRFNINYDHHCIINHNSGVGLQAAIYGSPVICHPSSLAYPISIDFKDIEEAYLPDRSEWFLKICHTEWTCDELSLGVPQKRLIECLTVDEKIV